MEGTELARRVWEELQGGLLGRAGWVDMRLTERRGLVTGVRAGGWRQSSGPPSHWGETKLGFPYKGTPPGF